MTALADDSQSLRRCIRDLVAFTALPAFWAGREPRAIVESLADVLWRTLGLDFVYVCVQGSPGEVALQAVRTAQQSDIAGQTQAISQALALWLKSADANPLSCIPNPAGSGMVRLIALPIGVEGRYGVVAAGSQQEDFPTESDRLLLNVGANQMAIWLREARLHAALREADQLKDQVLAREQEVCAELTEWKNRYEAAIQATGQLLYDWNSQTQQVLWGGETELLLGYSPEEMPKTLIGAMVLLHPQDRAAFSAEIKRVRATKTPFHLECRMRRKDGVYITVENKGHFFSDGVGNAVHVVGFVADITARKQKEEDSARLAAIVESSEDAILSKTLDGIILSWNRGAERLYGYTAEEVIGQSVALLAPPEQQDEIPRILERLRRGERLEHYETVRRKKDGTRVSISLTVSPVKNAAGEIIGASAIARDITARKQAETKVQRINAELQQFAYIVSHDLQEPLRTVASFVSLLAKRYQGRLDADAEEYITFAVDGARRMQQMIQGLLAYARVGGQTQKFAIVDCEELLTHVINDLRGAITAQQATITHDPLPTIPGDAVRLKQVFQNLLGNALKFRGEAPPCVHVSAQRVNGQWRFVVRDNGIGLNPQQAGRLFQVFQRLHPRSAYPGTGIGLAICKKIIEQHGGQIWVESAPGQGAAFFFTLAMG